jgi:hypothetical protein
LLISSFVFENLGAFQRFSIIEKHFWPSAFPFAVSLIFTAPSKNDTVVISTITLSIQWIAALIVLFLILTILDAAYDEEVSFPDFTLRNELKCENPPEKLSHRMDDAVTESDRG